MNIMIVRTIRKRPDSKLDMDQDFKREMPVSVSKSNIVNENSQIEDVTLDFTHRSIYSIHQYNGNEAGTSREVDRNFQNKPRKSIQRSKRKGDGGQLAIMLLTVSFAFLLLTLPTSVRSVLYTFEFFAADSNKEHAQAALVVATTSRLMLVNGAINFWLYSIAGQTFRHDLKNIFTSCSKPLISKLP